MAVDRLRDAAHLAACLSETAAACIVSEGSDLPVVHVRGDLAAEAMSAGVLALPDLAAQDGGIVFVGDVHADARMKAHVWAFQEPRIRFLAAVPLTGDDGVAWGTLYLIDTRRRRLSGKMRAALEALARQTAASLASSIGRPATTSGMLNASILRMLTVDGAGMDLDAFLQICVNQLSKILGLERVQIAQPCPDEAGWMQTLAISASGAKVANFRFTLSGTPCETALKNGVFVCPEQARTKYPRDRDLAGNALDGYVGLQLRSHEGHSLGVLAAFSRRPLGDTTRVLAGLRMAAIGIGAVLERHRADDAISESTRFNRALLNTLASHVAVLDAKGRIIFTNHAWDEFAPGHGIPTGKGSVGTDYLANCHATSDANPVAAQAATLLRDVLSGRAHQGSFEYLAETPGERRWFKCTVKQFTGPAMKHVLIAHDDITEIKQAQRRTDHMQQQFRHLFESAPDAIFMVDQFGQIRLANRKAEDMFGYTLAELVDKPVEILIDTKNRWRHKAMRHRFLESQRESAMGDSRNTLHGQRSDGMEFPVEISLSRFSGEGDEYVIASVRDVTMRLQAQVDRVARDVAEEASQAKSLFLATMSHEIRTPLSAVLGLAEILSKSNLSDDQLSLLGNMRDSAGHLLRLIDDVLDFSKIEAGSLELEEAPINLPELIEAAARGLADHAAARGVALHLFIAPELPARVLSDEVRLRQIIYNLLGNAIKFSSGAGRRDGRASLRAEFDHADGRPILTLVFADNGIGVDSHTMDKLFRPFTQGEGTTTRKFGGTGLGLTICKRIIDRFGGEIAMQSAPQKGLCITVRIPLNVLPALNTDSPARLAGVVCLLGDNAAYAQDDLRRYLMQDGASVVLLNTGDAGASAAFETDRTVLIIGTDDPEPKGVLQSLPRVLVGQHGSQRLTLRAHNRIFIDSRAMTRGDLCNAVALALGRGTVAQAAIKALQSKDDVPAFSAQAGIPSILVAEDDLLNQTVILRQLELLGLRGDVADDGVEALAKWRAGEYALLLTDLHMPNMDGYALTAAIRAEEARGVGGQRLPILALTANALRDEFSRARSLGMDGYLTKPIALARLADSLRPWLPAAAVTEYPAPDETYTGAIDRSVHAELIGGDKASVCDFLTAYCEASCDLVARFAKSVAAGDHEDATMIVHRLKSSSRWIGARAFGDLCEQLETALKGDDSTLAAARLADFQRLHGDVLKEIERICDEEASAQ